MSKAIVTIVCALIAPAAFAQPNTSTADNPHLQRTESTTYSTGTVTKYEPGKTVVVQSNEGVLSFALGTASRIVDGAGKVVTAPLRAGQKVRVYYTGTGEKRVVDHVVIEK